MEGARATAVKCDLNGLRHHEFSFAHDQLGARFVVFLLMQCDQAIDHLPLTLANPGQIDFAILCGDAELAPAIQQVRDLRAVNHVLARQAGDVRTRTANVPPLNDCRLFAL